MQIYFSLLVCIIGGAFYALSDNGKVQVLGLHAYWCGLLAFLLNGVPHLGVIGR